MEKATSQSRPSNHPPGTDSIDAVKQSDTQPVAVSSLGNLGQLKRLDRLGQELKPQGLEERGQHLLTKPMPPKINLKGAVVEDAFLFMEQIEEIRVGFIDGLGLKSSGLQGDSEALVGRTSPNAGGLGDSATGKAGAIAPEALTLSRSIWEKLSAEELMTLFLKLNINDPNNSVETHNALHQLGSELRQQGIAEAQKRAENAAKLREEARDFAEKMGVVMAVVQVISIVTFIFGIGAAIMAAQQAAQQAVTQVMKKALQAALKELSQQGLEQLVAVVSQVLNAGIQTAVTEKNADAKDSELEADRFRLLAELMQQMVEDQSEIIKVIM